MSGVISSTRGFSARRKGSSAEVRLERLEAFLARVRQLEAAFGPLVASSRLLSTEERAYLVHRYQSSVLQACSDFASGSYQVAPLVFKSPGL